MLNTDIKIVLFLFKYFRISESLSRTEFYLCGRQHRRKHEQFVHNFDLNVQHLIKILEKYNKNNKQTDVFVLI